MSIAGKLRSRDQGGSWPEVRLFPKFDEQDAVPINQRRKGRRSKTLSLSDKIDAVWQVLIEHSTQKEVAKEYRVSQSVLSKLI